MGTLAAAGLLIAPAASLAASGGSGAGSAGAAAGASRISPVGELDCNGYSPFQRPVKPGGLICAEVHLAQGGSRFEDNGHYIGHDEPTVQFYSNQPGSSTNVTYVQTLPRDPTRAADGARDRARTSRTSSS